jgi:hypothetical protein
MWLLRKKTAGKKQAATKGKAPTPSERALRHSRRPDAAKVLEALEHPELGLEPEEEGFDPYNSGVFDRSKIWEDYKKRS